MLNKKYFILIIILLLFLSCGYKQKPENNAYLSEGILIYNDGYNNNYLSISLNIYRDLFFDLRLKDTLFQKDIGGIYIDNTGQMIVYDSVNRLKSTKTNQILKDFFIEGILSLIYNYKVEFNNSEIKFEIINNEIKGLIYNDYKIEVMKRFKDGKLRLKITNKYNEFIIIDLNGSYTKHNDFTFLKFEESDEINWDIEKMLNISGE